MLLTAEQLHEIRQIIEDYHNAFVANVISPEAVKAETLQRLKDKGLINVQVNSAEDAYVFGQLASMLDDPKIANMTYDQFKTYLKANPIPLTPIEQRAVQIAQHQAAQYAVGLGNRIDTSAGQTILTTDIKLQNRMRDTIRDLTAESIAKRQTARQLKSQLGHATKDWARDWDRIAITETHNAMQRGTADHIAKKHGGGARVAKIPMPDACPRCLWLHLGPDRAPRIFKLSQLEKNGTNVGRKAADWLPVVGVVHTHCQCQLIHIPKGWGFNDEGQLTPNGRWGIDYESNEDLEFAVKEEMDLVKSIKVTGHVNFQDIPIAIENAPDTIRHWKAPDGTEGNTHMLFAYGYVENSGGMDGDEVDVYVGPDPRAQMVYVIHQQNPNTGIYDETKTMLGFPSEQMAVEAYKYHFNRDDFLVTVDPMSVGAFKRWVANTGHRNDVIKKGKPAVRLTIPLQKSELGSYGKVAPEMVETMADARAPGPGVGANYLFNTPQRTRTPTLKESGFDPAPREMLDQLAQRHLQGKKNKEDYVFNAPLPPHSVVKPIVLPDDFPDLSTLEDEEEIEARKKALIKEGMKNTAAVKNYVEVGKK